MDYEFLRDVTGRVLVRMSMGHEVVGHWFNEEVKENLALLDEVEQAANAVKGSERSWQRAGHEYTLWMDGEEVMIRANQLEFTGEPVAVRRRGFPAGGKRLSGISASILNNFNHQLSRASASGFFLPKNDCLIFINHFKTVI